MFAGGLISKADRTKAAVHHGKGRGWKPEFPVNRHGSAPIDFEGAIDERPTPEKDGVSSFLSVERQFFRKSS